MSNSLPVSIDTQSDQRCQHIDSRGHRCRMLTSGSHDSLCPHHLNRLKAERAKDDQAVAAALLADIDDFSTPSSVNLFLGNLLKELVHKRVRRRDAIAQAYLCQLLLNTFPHMLRVLDEEDEEEDMEGAELLLKSFLEARTASTAQQNSAETSTVPLYPVAAGPS
jgi:hypothetical protein